MKNLTKTILGGLAIGFISCALFSEQAQAVQIQGNILLGGRVTFDQPLATATTVTTFFNVFGTPGMSSVLATTGDFSGIPLLTSATMATPWVFNPPTPTLGLWSVGGFTFDLLTSTIVTQLPNFLNIEATGVIHGAGFDDTPGTFRIAVTGRGIRFGFAALTQAVPDGGSAVALLGLALIGIEAVRRKLRRTGS
jgi:VPDSG-CTERM motif